MSLRSDTLASGKLDSNTTDPVGNQTNTTNQTSTAPPRVNEPSTPEEASQPPPARQTKIGMRGSGVAGISVIVLALFVGVLIFSGDS